MSNNVNCGANTFWIGNGKVVLPDRICENGSVLVKYGRITDINKPCPQNVECLDACGGYITPGFIDIHLHGGGNHDFMDGCPKIFSSCRLSCKHSTTAIFKQQ